MIETDNKGGSSKHKDSFVTEDEDTCGEGAKHNDVSKEESDSSSTLFNSWSLRVESLCLKESISQKASPLLLKNWIELSLTLNGRDKITKIIQYSSRLIAYYYESSAASLFANDTHQGTLLTRAKKFRNLQKALTSSRKAYRLGRTIVEIDKLNSMGLLYWITWYFRQALILSIQALVGRIE